MTLAELFADYNAEFTASPTEIAAWNTLDPVQIEADDGDVLRSGRLS
jgi:hypothetical protein